MALRRLVVHARLDGFQLIAVNPLALGHMLLICDAVTHRHVFSCAIHGSDKVMLLLWVDKINWGDLLAL